MLPPASDLWSLAPTPQPKGPFQGPQSIQKGAGDTCTGAGGGFSTLGYVISEEVGGLRCGLCKSGRVRARSHWSGGPSAPPTDVQRDPVCLLNAVSLRELFFFTCFWVPGRKLTVRGSVPLCDL